MNRVNFFQFDSVDGALATTADEGSASTYHFTAADT